MRLKITYHAQHRFEERGISVERIKQTVKDPDKIEDALDDNKKARKKFGNKTLEVIFL